MLVLSKRDREINMSIQHNAYEINKEYRHEQERRSEKQRVVDTVQAKEEKSTPSVFVQIISIITR
jgi:hypothetical protein